MKRACWFALAILFAAGCSSGPPPSLVGEYTVEINGSTMNVARITQDGAGYGMSWWENDSWVPAKDPVTVLSKSELGNLVTGPVDKIIGLQSNSEAILGVPKGWTQIYLGHGGRENVVFKAATGYVWRSPLGFVDLKKKQ